MDFLFDNIKLLIFIGAAVLWVIGKIVESKKAAGQSDEPLQPWEPDEDYENWEPDPAPQSGPPPFPYARGQSPPPLSAYFTPAEDELQRQQAMQEKLAVLRKEKRAAAKKTPRKKAASAPTPLVSPSIKARLRDRKELRRAFVMREILDPPVGLR